MFFTLVVFRSVINKKATKSQKVDNVASRNMQTNQSKGENMFYVTRDKM